MGPKGPVSCVGDFIQLCTLSRSLVQCQSEIFDFMDSFVVLPKRVSSFRFFRTLFLVKCISTDLFWLIDKHVILHHHSASLRAVCSTSETGRGNFCLRI